MVRAKFKVTRVEMYPTSEVIGTDENGREKYGPAVGYNVHLQPVYGNGDPEHENTKFWKATPTGKLELGGISVSVAEPFEVGKEFYIDITPA